MKYGVLLILLNVALIVYFHKLNSPICIFRILFSKSQLNNNMAAKRATTNLTNIVNSSTFVQHFLCKSFS